MAVCGVERAEFEERGREGNDAFFHSVDRISLAPSPPFQPLAIRAMIRRRRCPFLGKLYTQHPSTPCPRFQLSYTISPTPTPPLASVSDALSGDYHAVPDQHHHQQQYPYQQQYPSQQQYRSQQPPDVTLTEAPYAGGNEDSQLPDLGDPNFHLGETLASAAGNTPHPSSSASSSNMHSSSSEAPLPQFDMSESTWDILQQLMQPYSPYPTSMNGTPSFAGMFSSQGGAGSQSQAPFIASQQQQQQQRQQQLQQQQRQQQQQRMHASNGKGNGKGRRPFQPTPPEQDNAAQLGDAAGKKLPSNEQQQQLGALSSKNPDRDEVLEALQRDAYMGTMPSLSSVQGSTLPNGLFAGGFYLADMQKELQGNGDKKMPAHCAVGLTCDDDELLRANSSDSSSCSALCRVFCAHCQRQAVATKGGLVEVSLSHARPSHARPAQPPLLRGRLTLFPLHRLHLQPLRQRHGAHQRGRGPRLPFPHRLGARVSLVGWRHCSRRFHVPLRT